MKPLDNPLVNKLANIWLAHEQPVGVPPEIALDHAAARVKLVLEGEVRWSEASRGDKAIWHGRIREVEKFQRWWRTSERSELPQAEQLDAVENDLFAVLSDALLSGDRLHAFQLLAEFAKLKGMEPPARAKAPPPGYRPGHERAPFDPVAGPDTIGRGHRVPAIRELLWWNMYDTMKIRADEPRGRNMFGNSNIGDYFRTNLQVPGQFGSEQTAVILGMFVSSESFDGLCWAADNAIAELVVGSRPMTPNIYVRELIMGVRFARPVIIPVRQNFTVRVSLRREVPLELDFELVMNLDALLSRSVQ